ncbi:MAG: hypothetical protein ACKO2K_18160 [Alphaproteobacteria bacterium]
MKKGVICTVAGALAILGAGQAHALVLAAKSEAQGIRADISAQNLAATACLVKANLACEASSTTLASDCNLVTQATQNGADAKVKYAGDIAKCASKFNYLKKNKSGTDASSYESVGCTGDSNSGTPGNQRFTNMTAYQSSALLNIKNQLNLLSAIIGSFIDVDPNTVGNQPCADEKCIASAASGLSKYAQALQKCIIACENDYSAKKGNGGTTDAGNCLVAASGITGAAGADPAFTACVDKAWASATKKYLPLQSLAGTVGTLLGNAANNLYNLAPNCN